MLSFSPLIIALTFAAIPLATSLGGPSPAPAPSVPESVVVESIEAFDRLVGDDVLGSVTPRGGADDLITIARDEPGTSDGTGGGSWAR